MTELPTVKAVIHRLDVPCVRIDFGDEPHVRSAHFVLPSGECATLSLVALAKGNEVSRIAARPRKVQES